jgi:anti-sigma B factor antagonist
MEMEANHMTTVHLSGSIDLRTSPAARGQLLAELRNQDALHIDLSGVTEIDSSGLAILVEVYMAARKSGRQVDLVNVGDAVARRIRLAHLDGVFALAHSGGIRTVH